MQYASDIRRLRRHILLGDPALLLVFAFGVLSLMLFFNPGLIGTPQEQHQYYRGQFIWLLVGAGFLLFAIACRIFATKESRHLIWVYNNVRPNPMRLTIQVEPWADSINYYAILSSDDSEEAPLWTVSLYSPTSTPDALNNKQVPVKVYLDPKTNAPAVIETEVGLLWAGATSKSERTAYSLVSPKR